MFVVKIEVLIYPRVFLLVKNMFSDILAQRFQILVEKPYFIIKRNGNGMKNRNIPPHFVCMLCSCVVLHSRSCRNGQLT